MYIGSFVHDYVAFVPWGNNPLLELAVFVRANCVPFGGMYSPWVLSPWFLYFAPDFHVGMLAIVSV